jgi:hypothetical protein
MRRLLPSHLRPHRCPELIGLEKPLAPELLCLSTHSPIVCRRLLSRFAAFCTQTRAPLRARRPIHLVRHDDQASALHARSGLELIRIGGGIAAARAKGDKSRVELPRIMNNERPPRRNVPFQWVSTHGTDLTVFARGIETQAKRSGEVIAVQRLKELRVRGHSPRYGSSVTDGSREAPSSWDRYRLSDGLDLAIAVITLVGGVLSAAAAWLAFLSVRASRSDRKERSMGNLTRVEARVTTVEIVVVSDELVEALATSLTRVVSSSTEAQDTAASDEPQLLPVGPRERPTNPAD